MACQPHRSEDIRELVSGGLDEARSEEFLGHVERCEACSAELDLVCKVVAVHAEPAELPGATELVPRAGPSRVRALRLAPLLAAAAALVALLAFWFAAGREPASTTSQLASVPPLPWSESVLRGAASPAEDVFREAMRAYERGEHERAAAELGRLIDGAPEAPGADLMRLYRGISLLQTNAAEAAAEDLERASQSAEGLLRERCLWYLAHAQLAAGRPAAASATLDRLIAEAGDYELDATEKRDALRDIGNAND